MKGELGKQNEGAIQMDYIALNGYSLLNLGKLPHTQKEPASSFPAATVTKSHSLGGLQQQNFILSPQSRMTSF